MLSPFPALETRELIDCATDHWSRLDLLRACMPLLLHRPKTGRGEITGRRSAEIRSTGVVTSQQDDDVVVPHVVRSSFSFSPAHRAIDMAVLGCVSPVLYFR